MNKRSEQSTIPDAEPAALTDNASISAALRTLSTEMIRIGTAMDYYGGFGPMGAHSLEMLSAAGIAGKWADGIDALPTAACEQGCNGCENCTDYDESQEAGKRDTADQSADAGEMVGLGFVIEGGTLRYDDGGCHPATDTELAMWEALQRRDTSGGARE